MAARVTELTASIINAKADVQSQKAALNLLLDGEKQAKDAYRKHLSAMQGATPPADAEAQAVMLEATYNSYATRISAARKAVTLAENDLSPLEAELATLNASRVEEDERIRQAAAAAGPITVGAPNSNKDPKRGFQSHRHFLSDVMRAGLGGGVSDLLKPLAAAPVASNGARFRAAQGSDEQGAYSDQYGGFLVPHGVAPGILMVQPEDDPLDALVRKVPLNAPTVSFNARVDKDHTTSVSGGLVVTRHPETVDGTSSRMKFEQVVMTANEEIGIAFATERILTDSPESFVAVLAAGFSDEYTAAAMRERITGSGNGEREGILNTPALITVAKETGQLAKTILKENIDKMAARCWRYGRAIWLANHNTRPQLKSIVQVIGTGGSAVPYFTTQAVVMGDDGGSYGVGDGSSGVNFAVKTREFLDGRPIYFTEFCKALGTLGDLILVVPSEYLEGTYESEQYAESIHARFVAVERAFRFYRRNDGRSWWKAALTPANGDSLSPFVVLAARA